MAIQCAAGASDGRPPSTPPQGARRGLNAEAEPSMCGRFTLTKPQALTVAFPQFRYSEFSETGLPRYNIAPAQEVLGVRNDGRATVEALHWGIRGRINIRAESVVARRNPVRRRCIEFADGFYEWRERRPFYYTLKSGEPFVFAGLWEPRDGGASCDIVTCEPNALVAPVHDRMPVILRRDQIELWLDPEPLPPDVAHAILQPLDPGGMQVREVSKRVNSANYEAADVLDSAEPRLL
jgi:putative SOS response-associated peptidase YedK